MGLELIITILVALVVFVCFLCTIYKVADIDKVLIVTGGKKPKIKVSGGSFVMPIFRKYSYFDLCMLTVTADKDEIKTITAVPIITDWTAQIRPDASNLENLQKAIVSFKERGKEGIINDVKYTLTGAVRDIVASMTPEAVLRDKTEFAEKVKETVADEMANMGMELVSLNIQDVTDNNHYYDNIATLDMEEKRNNAEKKKAVIDQEVRKQKAESDEIAAKAELDSKLAVAEKVRDTEIKNAQFKAETDQAKASAEAAGIIQQTIKEQEIATQEGRVEVIKQEQANLAAIKEREVLLTRAEANKRKLEIEAETKKNILEKEAEAKISVAEKEAEATKTMARATAEKIRQEGQAEADVIREKGIAVAEAEKAKLLASAEGEKALADARASNEKVNFEIEKMKIEANAKIEIATKTAQVMAEIGKNAEFVNLGSTSANGGNVLFDTLSSVPELMKLLNVKSEALNDKDFNTGIQDLVKSIAEPIKSKKE